MENEINKNVICWKFSETAKEKPLIKGNIKDFLNKVMFNPFMFGYYNLNKSGIYRLLGYAFDFRPYLKEYVYKTNYGIQEGYFLNKENVRKNTHTHIAYILEIK